MKLLIVNANTSQSITDLIVDEAKKTALPGTRIVAVTGTFGARVISTRVENAIAEHSVVELVARHGAGCDAVLIAVSFDTGLRAAREMSPVPVVGMTEAALLTACMIAPKVGMVTIGRRSATIYEQLVASYGLSSRVAAIRPAEPGATDIPTRSIPLAKVVAAARRAIDDGAEAVILCGAARAGMPRQIQKQLPVPVLEGVSCGVRMAELLARSRLAKPTVGSFSALPAKELIGVDPAIAALFTPTRRRR